MVAAENVYFWTVIVLVWSGWRVFNETRQTDARHFLWSGVFWGSLMTCYVFARPAMEHVGATSIAALSGTVLVTGLLLIGSATATDKGVAARVGVVSVPKLFTGVIMTFAGGIARAVQVMSFS